MTARETTQKHAETLKSLLTRMQTACEALPTQERIDWGHAGQTRDALQYAVYAAFALGVVGEDESRQLGFPC